MEVIWNDFYGLMMATTKEYGFGGDALLLAEFASPKNKDKILDLCTGCGVIPVMMISKGFKGKVVAVDIQKDAVNLCEMTREKNHLEEQFYPVCEDLKNLSFPAESFSLVTVNPPYFSSGSGKENGCESRDLARRESGCTLADVCRVSSKMLLYGGRLCMCHRPERLSDVFYEMRKNNIEPKKLTLVNNESTDFPWLVLVEGKKGGHTGLTIRYIKCGK